MTHFRSPSGQFTSVKTAVLRFTQWLNWVPAKRKPRKRKPIRHIPEPLTTMAVLWDPTYPETLNSKLGWAPPDGSVFMRGMPVLTRTVTSYALADIYSLRDIRYEALFDSTHWVMEVPNLEPRQLVVWKNLERTDLIVEHFKKHHEAFLSSLPRGEGKNMVQLNRFEGPIRKIRVKAREDGGSCDRDPQYATEGSSSSDCKEENRSTEEPGSRFETSPK